MGIYVKYLLFSIFSLFFWFSDMLLSDALILPVSQLVNTASEDVTN